ncbi:MAG TPA: 4Fe-4S dicluster domain-containing protein, partial [Polyangium sp.]|nr:4Fe-4S dicluster domain-containing protein [Polyangium sp.]
SLGSTNTFIQASVLDMYDPDRSQGPRERGEDRTWDDASAFLRKLGDDARKKNGKGLALLLDDHRSPTVAAQIDALLRLMPDTRVVRYEAFGNEAALEGAKLTFGRSVNPVYDLAEADVVVTLDSDFLVHEPSAVKNARAFAARRNPDRKDKPMSRMYSIESTFSVTGTNADHRLRVESRKVTEIAYALAQEIAAATKQTLPGEITGALNGAPALDPKAAKFVKAIAADVAKRNGNVAIIPGRKQPASVHALVNVVHQMLGSIGKTVKFVRTLDEVKGSLSDLAVLAKDIESGAIETLVVFGGNPVFNAPADVRGSIAKAKMLVHVGTHVDDTGAVATWHLNRAHTLESWGDLRAADGTGSIIQPLIAPMYGGKTDAEILETFIGGTRKAYDLIRSSWRGPQTLVADFDRDFRRALHDGVWKDSAYLPESVVVQPGEVATAIKTQRTNAAKGNFEVVFEPCPHTWDGRYANNGWLQELPDSMHKLTWGNVAAISPATAKGMGVADGDLVTVSANGKDVTLPALIAVGQADNTVVMTIGQGRKNVGRVGKGIGVATGDLRTTAGFHIADGKVTKAGGSAKLARTQEHFLTEGRPMVHEAGYDKYKANPAVVPAPKKYLSLFDEKSYDKGHQWGMSIDLTACIGCNACTVACQAENNISVVGFEGVTRSREMHWIRIDRYFEGKNPDEPTAIAQPTMCNHCENAPCEEVCPVAATTHSPEGLNDMAYNRCIGTKYCANNCPFKVRRFNYFDYTKDTIEVHKMQMNPDVTVRSRGVMEKCTFCVQRINSAKISAKVDGRERVRDGEVVTACQAACPTQAIHFGDLNDKQSVVAKDYVSPRAYRQLEEVNVRSRLSYLAKIKNPNPELEGV